ncbi:hypothetical protein ETB97_010045 [Aspergillus alliaceus]|uniref:Heterokaryon incompatibility domain-containing protein n=1 Tax=Petromyces alliaceus TaxID=209559 RepID=A0A8H6E1U3_PETAA|nr:hypothetical protein ETB97_010045 [Aspergillus burnettii]
MSNNIPENDKNRPRWLLDIDLWLIFPYDEIEQIGEVGYGIVSYTWGMWADFDTPVPEDETPNNLKWKIPSVKGLSIKHAREVLTQTMDMKYVWWDWMCVPQGKAGKKVTLGKDLEEVKGEEVAKQMHIYKGAKKSIVWLHRTNWDKCPRLAGYLKGSLQPLNDFGDTIADFALSIKGMQEEEPWLTSGWTLQEGVLLEKTTLLDYNGKSLSGDFEPGQKQARVLDLSIPATPLAIHIATAFVRVSEGWTSSKNMPQGMPEQVKQAIDFISASQSNYERAATCLSKIVSSGLVAYWPGKATALYILAGADGRRFTVPEDRCWALLGALDLEDVEPWYVNWPKVDEKKAMKEIKTKFFVPLLKKYQWELLVLPEIVDQHILDGLSWPERAVHGGFLPLGIYFTQDIELGLPALTYNEEKDELTSTPGKFIKLKKRVFCRRYRQARLGVNEGFIEVAKITSQEPSGHLYCPLVDIPVPDISTPKPDGWSEVKKGKRCVHIELIKGGDTSGCFKGIVDLWGIDDAFEKLDYPEFNICGPKPRRGWGRCVMA